MPAQKHLHKYRRDRKNKQVYHCLEANCTHWTWKEHLKGKEARCAEEGCDRRIILTPELLLRVKPKCIYHMNTAESRARNAALEAFTTAIPVIEDSLVSEIAEAKDEKTTIDSIFNIAFASQDSEKEQ